MVASDSLYHPSLLRVADRESKVRRIVSLDVVSSDVVMWCAMALPMPHHAAILSMDMWQERRVPSEMWGADSRFGSSDGSKPLRFYALNLVH
jgi:hypothetical protein